MQWLHALSAAWAFLAGTSVTLQLGGTIALNGRSVSSPLHSLYVTQGCVFVGAVWLAIFAYVAPGDPPERPTRLWSMFGGVVTLPAFVTTPAAQVLGIQVVLMVLLVGMIGMALIFDFQGRRVNLGRIQTTGLALLFVAVVLELLDAVPHVEGNPTEVILSIFACLFAGVLFAVQSKMNRRLARFLGSSLRSATWSNASCFAVGVQVLLCVRFYFEVRYEFKTDQLWIWPLLGLQNAFYTLTLALLPKILGYSLMFVLLTAGKLCSSVMADTLGAFQPPVPLSVLRCASVVVMLIGAFLYTLLGPPTTPDADDPKTDLEVEWISKWKN